MDKLEKEWIKEVIDNDFLQCQDLPLAYEEILDECNINARFTKSQKALLSWIEQNQKLTEEEGGVSQASRQSLGSSSAAEGSAAANNRGAQFWGFLFREEKIDAKSFLALVGFLIDRGSSLTSSAEEHQKCFLAAKLYLTMVCIPGSMAFGVFHQMLYTKALQLIELYLKVSKAKTALISVHNFSYQKVL